MICVAVLGLRNSLLCNISRIKSPQSLEAHINIDHANNKANDACNQAPGGTKNCAFEIQVVAMICGCISRIILRAGQDSHQLVHSFILSVGSSWDRSHWLM